MDITSEMEKYFDDICDISYHKHCEEVKHHIFLKVMSKSSFVTFFRQKLEGMNCLVGIENGKCIGFLLYSLRNEKTEVNCAIPTWGYGSNSEYPEKTIGYLFQSLAGQIVLDKKVNFSVRLYAHDEKIQKLFSFMQFGIIAEKGIRRIVEIEHSSDFKVREISKNELEEKWREIWGLLAQLISHLQKSPVFYSCGEFTEEVYKGFLEDSGTKVYVAEDANKIIGLIESNSENVELFPDVLAVNVGEAYVIPAYRGHKVAQALLHCLDRNLLANSVEYEWVEHGTANPNARGFWNKYFETFEYEFIRNIECPI